MVKHGILNRDSLLPACYSKRLCEFSHMATNLSIDEKLLNKALRIGGRKTKKDTVNEALAEYIRRREQKKIVALFGTVEEDGYDPKQYRRRP